MKGPAKGALDNAPIVVSGLQLNYQDNLIALEFYSEIEFLIHNILKLP